MSNEMNCQHVAGQYCSSCAHKNVNYAHHSHTHCFEDDSRADKADHVKHLRCCLCEKPQEGWEDVLTKKLAQHIQDDLTIAQIVESTRDLLAREIAKAKMEELEWVNKMVHAVKYEGQPVDPEVLVSIHQRIKALAHE